MQLPSFFPLSYDCALRRTVISAITADVIFWEDLFDARTFLEVLGVVAVYCRARYRGLLLSLISAGIRIYTYAMKLVYKPFQVIQLSAINIFRSSIEVLRRQNLFLDAPI